MEPILLRPAEAASLIGVGHTKFYALLRDGTIPGGVRIGSSIRVSREALVTWVREQVDEEAVRDGRK